MKQKKSISGLHVASNMLWPEVYVLCILSKVMFIHVVAQAMVLLISRRFYISETLAKEK